MESNEGAELISESAVCILYGTDFSCIADIVKPKYTRVKYISFSWEAIFRPLPHSILKKGTFGK